MHSSMNVGYRMKRLRQRQLKEGNEAKGAIEHVGLRTAGTSELVSSQTWSEEVLKCQGGLQIDGGCVAQDVKERNASRT